MYMKYSKASSLHSGVKIMVNSKMSASMDNAMIRKRIVFKVFRVLTNQSNNGCKKTDAKYGPCDAIYLSGHYDWCWWPDAYTAPLGKWHGVFYGILFWFDFRLKAYILDISTIHNGHKKFIFSKFYLLYIFTSQLSLANIVHEASADKNLWLY